MRMYRLHITENAVDRNGHWAKPMWARVVRAGSRVEALRKCLPEIKSKVLPKIKDDTIKSVAVYCGEKAGRSFTASRMEPIRVTRQGRIKA